MSLDDWSTRFEDFVDRVNNQDDYRQMQARLIADRLVEERGLPRADALREARASMSRQDALHGPDQNAGGNPEQFTGFGDRGVNRSIGRRWRDMADVLGNDMADALDASGIPSELLGDVRMRVRLHFVDRLASSGGGA